MAVAASVMGDGYCAVPMRFPGSGLRKAQGLYQFVLFLTCVGHSVRLGLLGSGEPPGAKGSRTGIARAPPLAAVLMFGETENGVPVCAAQVKLVDQPPTVSSSHLEEFSNALPLPNGS